MSSADGLLYGAGRPLGLSESARANAELWQLIGRLKQLGRAEKGATINTEDEWKQALEVVQSARELLENGEFDWPDRKLTRAAAELRARLMSQVALNEPQPEFSEEELDAEIEEVSALIHDQVKAELDWAPESFEPPLLSTQGLVELAKRGALGPIAFADISYQCHLLRAREANGGGTDPEGDVLYRGDHVLNVFAAYRRSPSWATQALVMMEPVIEALRAGKDERYWGVDGAGRPLDLAGLVAISEEAIGAEALDVDSISVFERVSDAISLAIAEQLNTSLDWFGARAWVADLARQTIAIVIANRIPARRDRAEKLFAGLAHTELDQALDGAEVIEHGIYDWLGRGSGRTAKALGLDLAEAQRRLLLRD